jgi:hypothetical protein
MMADKPQTVLEMDEHVRSVMDFMIQEIPAARLVGVAAGIAQCAPLVWAEHQQEPVQPLRLHYS